MTNLRTTDVLINALSDLNDLLASSKTTIELTIVGSMAIYLNGLELNRMTEDIDYIDYNASDEFIQMTRSIAQKYDLPSDWINSRAKDIEPLPTEILKRLRLDNRFSNIVLKYIDIDTAIQMKVYAYYIRGLEKDLSDLKTLTPNTSQLTKGVEYIQTQIIHHHGKSQFNKDEAEINELLEFLKNELN